MDSDVYINTQTIVDLPEARSIDDKNLLLLGEEGTGALDYVLFSNMMNSIKDDFENLSFDDLTTSSKDMVAAINELVARIEALETALDGHSIRTVTSLPSSPDSSTLYFIDE